MKEKRRNPRFKMMLFAEAFKIVCSCSAAAAETEVFSDRYPTGIQSVDKHIGHECFCAFTSNVFVKRHHVDAFDAAIEQSLYFVAER